MGGITMNEIYTRVSIRKFEDRPVEPEKITQLLKAAMQAPSAGNQRPWEFYVVTDKEKIKRFPRAILTQVVRQAHLWSLCLAIRLRVRDFPCTARST